MRSLFFRYFLTMLISDSHQFVFVHVRKAAGTSLRQILGQVSLPKNNQLWYKLLSRNGFSVDYHKYSFRKHSALIEAEKSMPSERYQSYFKFAFVRNPWDRLVSEFEYIKTQNTHSRHKKLSQMTFEDYITYQGQRPAAHQFNVLCNKSGDLGVDYVGKFERLDDSLVEISNKVKLDCSQIPHINKIKRQPFQSYYNATTAEKVAKLWAKDIAVFDYQFD